jgi:hypothetical protein
MVRKLFCSMMVMVVAVAFVAAEEFAGTITKVDGDKVTVQKYKKAEKGKKGKGEKDGDPITLSAKGAKIVTGKFDADTKKLTDGDEVKDGLKNEMFTTIDDKKGVQAQITTEGEGDKATITKIRVGGKGKKKAAAE